MRLSIVFLTFFIGLSRCQQTQIGSSSNSGQGEISIPGNSGRLVDLFLHPLRPFLGEAGHKALHNALEVIPMSVLNQVSNIGQLFGALITFNPTAVPQLINQFFPGASSLFNLLPSFGTAGLGALSSLTGSTRSADNLLDGPDSNSISRLFDRRPDSFSSFPSSPSNSFSSYSSSDYTSSTNSPSFRETFNPANIASDLVGQGLSNFAGVTNSLADGQPLSALLAMAGGAADSFNRFGNLASTGATNMASGLASHIPDTVNQWVQNSPISPPRASPPRASPPRASPPRASPPRASPPRPSPPSASPPRTSPPSSINSGHNNERNTESFSSPLTSLLRGNPFTDFLTGR